VKRLVLACAGFVALATGVALAPVVTATAATSASSVSKAHWASQHVTVGAPRRVNLKAVSNATSGQHAALVPPFRHVGRSAAQRAAFQSGALSSVKTLAPPRLASSVSPAQDFPMMNLNKQVTDLGTDQSVEPPDTQVAAGPTDLVEAVNDSLSVWSKTGTLVLDKDLNAFFQVPSGFFFTDPRVLYDAESDRWFLSGWSFDASNDSQTYVGVSTTSDPTGNWIFYIVQNNSNHTLTDQPMIGACDDKFVISWDEFTGSSATPAYNGAQALVMQKSTLVNGLPSVGNVLFTTPNEFRLVPAQSLSATNTCYMAVNNASADLPGSTNTPMLGVVAITGTPALSDVSLSEIDLPIATTNAPSAPRQPGGAVEPATSNDDRLLSAVWQNNQLWTSATDACTPGGDTAVRNCMRLDEVNTSGGMSVTQDFDLATPGLDDYYPAVSLDSSGDLFVAYSASSPAQDAGAYAAISPASTDSFTPITIQAGSASYAGARWGDYSAAAPDPSTAGAVWVAGEPARGIPGDHLSR
jgi:hypothetical protein